MKSKIFALLLCAAVLFTVASCGPAVGNQNIPNLDIQDAYQTTDYPLSFEHGWGIGNGTVKQGATYRPYIVTRNNDLEATFSVESPSGKAVDLYYERFFTASETGRYTVRAFVNSGGKQTEKIAYVESEPITGDVTLCSFDSSEEIEKVKDVYGLISAKKPAYEYSFCTETDKITQGSGSLKITSLLTCDAIDETRWPTAGFFGKPGNSLSNDDERTCFDENGKPLIGIVDFSAFSAVQLDVFVESGSFSNYLLVPLISSVEGHELGLGFVPKRGEWFRVCAPVDMITSGKNNIFTLGICTDKMKIGDTMYVDNVKLVKGEKGKALLTDFSGKNEYTKVDASPNIEKSDGPESVKLLQKDAGTEEIYLHTYNGAIKRAGADLEKNQQLRAILLKSLDNYDCLQIKIKPDRETTVKMGFTAGALLAGAFTYGTGDYDPAVVYGPEIVLKANEWNTVEYKLSLASDAGISLINLDKAGYMGYGFLSIKYDGKSGQEILLKDFCAVKN